MPPPVEILDQFSVIAQIAWSYGRFSMAAGNIQHVTGLA
jgi:hypothetical protein